MENEKITCQDCSSEQYNYACQCGAILCIKCWNKQKSEGEFLEQKLCPQCQSYHKKELKTKSDGKKITKKPAIVKKKQGFSGFGRGETYDAWVRDETYVTDNHLTILRNMVVSPRLGIRQAVTSGSINVSLLAFYIFSLMASISHIIPWAPLIPEYARELCYYMIFTILFGIFFAFKDLSLVSIFWLYISSRLLRGKSSLMDNVIMAGYVLFPPVLAAFLLCLPLEGYLYNKMFFPKVFEAKKIQYEEWLKVNQEKDSKAPVPSQVLSDGKKIDGQSAPVDSQPEKETKTDTSSSASSPHQNGNTQKSVDTNQEASSNSINAEKNPAKTNLPHTEKQTKTLPKKELVDGPLEDIEEESGMKNIVKFMGLWYDMNVTFPRAGVSSEVEDFVTPTPLVIFHGILSHVCFFWGLILLFLGMKEVNGFSLWKTLLAFTIPIFIYIIVLVPYC